MNRRHFLAGFGAAPLLVTADWAADTGSLDSFQDLRKLFSSSQPVLWVFTGDSVTQGALHTFGWRSYPEHFAERVRWELKRLKDVVVNTGVSGDKMPTLLGEAEQRIFQFRPQVISLMMGMNDCVAGATGKETFQRSLESLHERALKQRSILLLHTPNLITVQATERRALPEYVELLRQFAAQHRLPLIDHYAYWTIENSSSSRLKFWLNDGTIHPNHFGHILLARKTFQDLGIFDLKSPTCRLFVP